MGKYQVSKYINERLAEVKVKQEWKDVVFYVVDGGGVYVNEDNEIIPFTKEMQSYFWDMLNLMYEIRTSVLSSFKEGKFFINLEDRESECTVTDITVAANLDWTEAFAFFFSNPSEFADYYLKFLNLIVQVIDFGNICGEVYPVKYYAKPVTAVECIQSAIPNSEVIRNRYKEFLVSTAL